MDSRNFDRRMGEGMVGSTDGQGEDMDVGSTLSDLRGLLGLPQPYSWGEHARNLQTLEESFMELDEFLFDLAQMPLPPQEKCDVAARLIAMVKLLQFNVELEQLIAIMTQQKQILLRHCQLLNIPLPLPPSPPPAHHAPSVSGGIQVNREDNVEENIQGSQEDEMLITF